MVVQHNMSAMNANRMLSITTGQQSKSTEKLSSGYRINRAADDAAGLSISEKMRKQIRGLSQAATNAQDGVSAVQTAEGALTEVHSMLQRMNELAVQAANGTNAQSDRDAIQSEVEQLTKEINRVSETTKFNETYLLKGGESEKIIGFKRLGNNDENYIFDSNGKVVTDLDSAYEVDSKTNGVKVRASAGALKKGAAEAVTNLAEKDGTSVKLKNTDDTVYAKDSKGNLTQVTADNLTNFVKLNAGGTAVEAQNDSAGDAYTFVKAGTAAADADSIEAVTAKTLSLDLHVGADSTAENKITLKIASMDANTLGIGEIDMSTELGATSSIDNIKAAIQRVSNQRSDLGAVQNRLEHTIDNLNNVVENTTSAESRIRDTDMAKEMVEYSKNNILAQAGQSMLAQANQSNQGVLSLLQ